MSRTAPEFYKGRQIDGDAGRQKKESNRSDCKAVKFAIALLLYFLSRTHSLGWTCKSAKVLSKSTTGIAKC